MHYVPATVFDTQSGSSSKSALITYAVKAAETVPQTAQRNLQVTAILGPDQLANVNVPCCVHMTSPALTNRTTRPRFKVQISDSIPTDNRRANHLGLCATQLPYFKLITVSIL